MDTGTGYTIIFMGILSGAFLVRWGMPFYLFHIMTWRCRENEWIYPWLFFAGAEACFALTTGSCIVSVLNGVDTLFGESFLFATGVAFRGLLRIGLMEDGLKEVIADEIFNPWGLAKI